jgi:hypothetical protein
VLVELGDAVLQHFGSNQWAEILGAWTIWKHRNCCVFYGIAPNLDACLAKADEERDVGASWGTRYFFADGSALISDKWVLM